MKATVSVEPSILIDVPCDSTKDLEGPCRSAIQRVLSLSDAEIAAEVRKSLSSTDAKSYPQDFAEVTDFS